MLKHATICRTNRAQQALRKQWTEQNLNCQEHKQGANYSFDEVDHSVSTNADDLSYDERSENFASLGSWLTSRTVTSCSSSPTPTISTTPNGRFDLLSSAPSSTINSPSKSCVSIGTTGSHIATRNSSSSLRPTKESMIKIYAQSLGQEVEYMTLHVNAQTKSQLIIRTLLKKFRLKHRDPNLFYLTLERWIRKDGIKFKSVMLLGDDACPLQLQQCCSNPPHDDIKFTLQMRVGVLTKIYCSDVCSDTKYKCLSLSTHTTVEETIGLMLHCLNLTIDCESKQIDNNDSLERSIRTTATITHHRQVSSPSSTGSSSSSSSSTSSSSGIESDRTHQTVPLSLQTTSLNPIHASNRLGTNSRTNSVTSISSNSNLSNSSISQSFSDHYCFIEYESTNFNKILEQDDSLVEVVQSLVDEARDQSYDLQAKSETTTPKLNDSNNQHQADQWFVIKLKRRTDVRYHSMKFTNPRQNMPLPPVPPSLIKSNNDNDLQYFVSTTQIEVRHNHHPVKAVVAKQSVITNHQRGMSCISDTAGQSTSNEMTTAYSRPINHHQKQMSAVINSNCDKMPPPPETLIWLPPIKPRRRNLTNASTTFGGPQTGTILGNKRRYDPNQLAQDLNQLNLFAEGTSESGTTSSDCKRENRNNLNTDMLVDEKPVITSGDCNTET